MYIKVKATPGAKKEVIKREDGEIFVIKVREPAERNLANRRIVELVARYFKTSVGKVRIVSGHRHPTKLLSVDI